ncbi:hypothetical protein TL16_g12206 [Triparma laevis f. inornata]|uniref:Leucine-rich repeat domain-containing protein n=1 Tax=Triparma laevis f. inornata TaxID=1714386 RepID=A0A9W7EU92_9STRA|nr:hypothetical protein TL16_g12206 [Triparma laevis f. inornata]
MTTVSIASPSWITKLRRPELRAELSDRFVKFDTKENKSVLIELLRLRLRCEILLRGNNFLNTDDFHRLLVPFLANDALMAIRLASKPWSRVADAFIDEGVLSGEFIVHDGKDLDLSVVYGRRERRELVTCVIFLPNIAQVGDWTCYMAINLVVVDIPEGVKSIREGAFADCRSLTNVSFPTTLTSIGDRAFGNCRSLDNVDLLHTNLQELGWYTFSTFLELKSITVPDSLYAWSTNVFVDCSKLVPSNIKDRNTIAVVAYLRSKQQNS